MCNYTVIPTLHQSEYLKPDLCLSINLMIEFENKANTGPWKHQRWAQLPRSSTPVS